MTQISLPPTPVLIASFFKRLLVIDTIIRIILNRANLSAAFTFGGKPQKKVLFDFSKPDASVEVDAKIRTAHIHVAIDARVMHDILLGKMKPGLAFGRRQLLLRGSAMNLAKFIPLFDFSPAIYREHLADTGCCGYTRKKGAPPLKEAVMNGRIFKGDPIPLTNYSLIEKITSKLINGFAFLMGYLVGIMRYRVFEKLSIFDVLSAMSKGMQKATPNK